jgi:hypothetical protein
MIAPTPRGLAPAALALGIVLAAGCASLTPRPTFTGESVSVIRISSPDMVKVKVDAPDGVTMLPEEQDRLGRTIKSKIDARKAANAADVVGSTYEVDVRVSRYDKGSAFARAMLAGLGQMHIEGKVAVFRMPEHRPEGEFELKKTFAWGGAYGAGTSIEDIENSFADGVAAAVTGLQHEPPKQKT